MNDPPLLIIPPMTEGEQRALAEVMKRPGVIISEPAPGFTFDRFHNALRIMKSIDLHELQAVGLFCGAVKPNREHDDWEHWETFRDDPLRFFITCDDETALKIFSVIESRQPKARS